MTAIELVEMVARMTPYADIEDDAVETMNRLILEARKIVELPIGSRDAEMEREARERGFKPAGAKERS